MTAGAKIHYLPTFLCGKVFREFETLYIYIVNKAAMNMNTILLGLGTYFFHIKQNCLSKSVWFDVGLVSRVNRN